MSKKLTESQINKIKELAYDNWEKAMNDDDHITCYTTNEDYEDMDISNPFIIDGRFETDLDGAYKEYGEQSVDDYIDALLMKYSTELIKKRNAWIDAHTNVGWQNDEELVKQFYELQNPINDFANVLTDYQKYQVMKEIRKDDQA